MGSGWGQMAEFSENDEQSLDSLRAANFLIMSNETMHHGVLFSYFYLSCVFISKFAV
jgi:hypothetical protein